MVDAVENAHRDEARHADDEQPHLPTTSGEEVDTVVTSDPSDTDVVVEDAHRDEARDEDDEQPQSPTSIAEEVDTVAARETKVTYVVISVLEDLHYE